METLAQKKKIVNIVRGLELGEKQDILRYINTLFVKIHGSGDGSRINLDTVNDKHISMILCYVAAIERLSLLRRVPFD